MATRLRSDDALDWDYVGAFPELFGFAVRQEPPAPPKGETLPPGLLAQAAAWMGDVLGKVKKILKTEHQNALYVQCRIDAWAEGARDLGIRLGLYAQRLKELEHGTSWIDRRRILADAWREELMRQAVRAEEAARSLREAAADSARRRELLRELIELQKQANAVAAKAKPKRKTPLGALKKLKSLTLKPSGKTKLKFKPLT